MRGIDAGAAEHQMIGFPFVSWLASTGQEIV